MKTSLGIFLLLIFNPTPGRIGLTERFFLRVEKEKREWFLLHLILGIPPALFALSVDFASVL